LSSGKEYTAFALFLLIIMAVVPLYVVAQNATHPPSTQQAAMFGDLQLGSTSVDLTDLGRNGINLNLKAVVFNPYGFVMTLEAANYSVYANGHYIGEGQLAQKYAITPRSSQTLVFPVRVSWESAFLTTGSYIVSLGSVNWKALGTADIEIGGNSFFISFEFATG
jgi:LEA14-like dessication related protein